MSETNNDTQQLHERVTQLEMLVKTLFGLTGHAEMHAKSTQPSDAQSAAASETNG